MFPLLALPEPFPTGLILWSSIGLVCALAVGFGMKGTWLSVAGDLTCGLVGSLIASVPIGFKFRNTEGFGGSLIVAFLGAVVLIALRRVVFVHIPKA